MLLHLKMQSCHLHSAFHQAEGSQTCLELQFVICCFLILTHHTGDHRAYQSKVCGGNDPVYGEGAEEDESSQQGQAEVETACPQARTSHPQNLMSGFQKGI